MDEDFSFNVKKERPEERYEHVWDYFKGDRLEQYALSKNIQRIQTRIAARSLDLLDLEKKNGLLLDAGCGPGFASFYLREKGYKVIALDIIPQFLSYYFVKDINPLVSDMCHPPFRPNIFDGIISISALQWIYRNPSSTKMETNFINLLRSFYTIVKPNAKIIFQFYPRSDEILSNMKRLINLKTEFDGGFFIDHPNNPKKRRIFLKLIK
jgi:SAM-dependent methyltransferase